MNPLQSLDHKISSAIEKVKALKSEKTALEQTVKALEKKLADQETLLAEKDKMIDTLGKDKADVRGQLEQLLAELESIGS